MDIEINNRNVYVVSDIHNDADCFTELLDKICFSSDDFLIIDGDIFDRGKKPVELYSEIISHSNIQVIQGNHDIWLAREILENGIKYQIAHAQTYKTPDRMWDKSKLYMGDGHYEYFIRGMEEHDDFISIVGHTATDDYKIWISPSGKTIRIDCGAGYKSYNSIGYLAALRLNDMKEYYV